MVLTESIYLNVSSSVVHQCTLYAPKRKANIKPAKNHLYIIVYWHYFCDPRTWDLIAQGPRVKNTYLKQKKYSDIFKQYALCYAQRSMSFSMFFSREASSSAEERRYRDSEWEWETLGYSVLNVMSQSNLSSLGSGIPVEKDQERVQEPEGLKDTKRASPYKSTWVTLMSTDRGWNSVHRADSHLREVIWFIL